MEKTKKEKPKKIKKLPQEELISFRNFFDQALHRGLVKSFQSLELEAYCKHKKLRSKETFETFLAAIQDY